MATIIEVNGLRPTIGEGVFLAPTALVIGDVRIGENANVWFGAVLRGDSSHIEIGEGTSVQDNAVIHCAEDLPTLVGRNVVVGHGAMLEGCIVEEGAVVGMGAIVLQRARVGAHAMLGAGAVLPEGAAVRAGHLAAGVPAREKKELSGSALAWTQNAAEHYQELRHQYLTTSRVSEERSQRAPDADWRRVAPSRGAR
jgi:carbonic anhydrase/acetyltransferase-like protein (isoleucine patch superfamily)